MGKTLKYVSEFSFPSDKGYSGSAGQQMVKGYARGGSCGYAKGGMKPMKKADGGAVDDPRQPLMDRTTRELIDAINAERPMSSAERRAMERGREALPFAISGAEREMMMRDPRVVMRLADMTRGPMSDAERMALLRPARGAISQGMRSPRAEMARERALMGEGYKKGGMAKGGKMDRLKGVIGNERKEMTRVEAKQRDAGQELSRVRSEMRYDKNEMKGMRKQYPTNRSEPMIAMKKGGHVSKKIMRKYDGGYIEDPSPSGNSRAVSPLVQISNPQAQPALQNMVPNGGVSLSPTAMKKGGHVGKKLVKMANGGALSPSMAAKRPPPQQINPGRPNVMGFPDKQPTQQQVQRQAGMGRPSGSMNLGTAAGPGGGRPAGPITQQQVGMGRPSGSMNLGTAAGPGGGRPPIGVGPSMPVTQQQMQTMAQEEMKRMGLFGEKPTPFPLPPRPPGGQGIAAAGPGRGRPGPITQQAMQQQAGMGRPSGSMNLGTAAGPGGGRPPSMPPQQMGRPAMAKGGMLYSKKEISAKNLLADGKAPALPHAKGSVNMAKGGMTAKQQGKVGKVMGEFKAGELHSGSKSGPVVKSRKQAIAIGMSEARKAKK